MLVIPYVLHVPMKNADGSIATGVDGDGTPVDGIERPQFDTLLSVANYTLHDLSVRMEYFNGADGASAPWVYADGHTAPYYDYLVLAGNSFAMTHIPGNIFSEPRPPQEFLGYAKIRFFWKNGLEYPQNLPAAACIGGGGFYPTHWNTFSASVPVIDPAKIVPMHHIKLPYVIPFFEDANHHGDSSYRTGLVVTNWTTEPTRLACTFHVGQAYPYAGAKYDFTLDVGPVRQRVEDLEGLLQAAGLPDGFNCEGWLEFRVLDGSTGTPAWRNLSIYAIAANARYNQFSFGLAGE